MLFCACLVKMILAFKDRKNGKQVGDNEELCKSQVEVLNCINKVLRLNYQYFEAMQGLFG